MWFEILPSAAIVLAGLALPHVSGYVMNKLVLGNMYRRSLATQDLRMQYLRDIRLTGDPYVTNGLENIPDS
ncbi:uncharacterized protein LOC109539463 [Dendroctonus ponderosae]